jgi:hypothetical protein
MRKLTLLLVLIILLNFSGYTEDYSYRVIANDTSGDTITKEYYQIVDGLNLDYVRYYNRLKSIGMNVKDWGWPESDSVFKHDSIEYWKSYRSFFKQDRDFIEWLLTFKHDNTKSILWQMDIDPLSSYRGDCFFKWNNSRAAITLIQNFLDGSGFKCYECGYSDLQKCNKKQFKKVEKFLKMNKSEDINELRQAWKIKNAH